jgi:hypothetical protein
MSSKRKRSDETTNAVREGCMMKRKVIILLLIATAAVSWYAQAAQQTKTLSLSTPGSPAALLRRSGVHSVRRIVADSVRSFIEPDS